MFQGKYLGKYGPMLSDGTGQRQVVGALVGKNNIEDLLAGPGLGKLTDQAGLGGAGPRPWPQLRQATLINVHHGQAALAPARPIVTQVLIAINVAVYVVGLGLHGANDLTRQGGLVGEGTFDGISVTPAVSVATSAPPRRTFCRRSSCFSYE